MQNNLATNIYTNISFGNPKQLIPLYIKFQYFSIFISDISIEGNFQKLNSSFSKSYKVIKNRTYKVQPFTKGIHSEDTLYINNKNEITDFNFILATELRYKQSGIIGFSQKVIMIFMLKNVILFYN
jgi:hypothetical protein